MIFSKVGLDRPVKATLRLHRKTAQLLTEFELTRICDVFDYTAVDAIKIILQLVEMASDPLSELVGEALMDNS